MKQIVRQLAICISITMPVASVAQPLAGHGPAEGLPAFVKVPEKAHFIQGEDLITDRLPEEDDSREEPTAEQRAAGMSAVVVDPDGELFEARMNGHDLAVFEHAIAALERSGHSAAMFTERGTHPNGAPQGAPNKDGSSARAIFGADNRVQVTNTVTHPYWHTGRFGNGCTGTLITPRHVLTAGRCVSNGYGSWYSNLDFTVAQNGSYKPWGTVGWSRAVTTSAWHQSHDARYDYALVVLYTAPHNGNAGWGVYDCGSSLWACAGGTYRVTGYPSEKPFATMWTAADRTWWNDGYRLCYYTDTGNQSGSGIADSSGYVRGVHTLNSSTMNCGMGISTRLYSQLKDWIANYP